MGKTDRLYIDVCSECDLSCKHCFRNGGRTQEGQITASEITHLMDDVRLLRKVSEVQLTGGEPTQRDDLFLIMRSLLDSGLNILLQTNGAFSSNVADRLCKLPGDRVRLIISLDGLESNDRLRGKEATRRTLANIERLHRVFDIRVNTLLTSSITWQEICQLAMLAKRYGLTLAFNPVCPSGRASVSHMMNRSMYFDFMYRLEELKDRGIMVRKCFDVIDNQLQENNRCPVRSGRSMHISSDGCVSPCGFLSGNPECQLGSIRDYPADKLCQKLPSSIRRLASDCEICDYHNKGQCNGGCPARIYALHGKFDAIDFYCMADYYKRGVMM